MVALLLLTTSTTAYGARTQALSDAERRALCAQAIREVETGRAYIESLETRLATAREQLDVATKQLAGAAEESRLLGEQKELLAQQVSLLESSLKLARENVAALERRVVELQEALNEERPKKWKFFVYGVLIGGGLVLLAGKE